MIDNTKDSSKSVSDRFIDGLNCLSRENLKAFEVGLEMAKNHLKKMFIQLQNFIDMNQVVASGSFLQVFIDEVIYTFYYLPHGLDQSFNSKDQLKLFRTGYYKQENS